MVGRKRKYKTDDEKRLAQNKSAMKYYFKNQEEIKRKNNERYHRNKMEKLNEEMFKSKIKSKM